MDRYSATRLALRIGVFIITVGPAQGQVRVGELVVTPAQDGVTVQLAREDRAGQLRVQQPVQTPDQFPVQEPGTLPQESQQQAQQQAQLYSEPHSPPQDLRQSQQPEPQYVQLQLAQGQQQLMAPPAVTRIILTADSLPPARPLSRPLPPLPAPRAHAMERDVLTLRAAHAAMQLDDQLHDRKMAALR